MRSKAEAHVRAILLTKGSAHGGACIEKGLKTCQLYTAALALEWVMCEYHNSA